MGKVGLSALLWRLRWRTPDFNRVSQKRDFQTFTLFTNCRVYISKSNINSHQNNGAWRRLSNRWDTGNANASNVNRGRLMPTKGKASRPSPHIAQLIDWARAPLLFILGRSVARFLRSLNGQACVRVLMLSASWIPRASNTSDTNVESWGSVHRSSLYHLKFN